MKNIKMAQWIGITFIVLGMTGLGCQAPATDLTEKLDTISGKLDKIEAKLKAGAGANAARKRPQRRGPTPGTVYSLDVDGLPYVGSKDAKVTVVKAYEFACPACMSARPFVEQIHKEYGDKVKIAWKSFVVHPNTAYPPAYAACAAAQQGKYKEMEELIWEKGFKAGRKLAAAHMETLAKEAGLNLAKYKADVDGECKKIVARDQKQLGSIGTAGTPTFFVNGRVLQGRSMPAVKAMIDQAMKEADGRIAKGTKPAEYYAEWVVKKGKKIK